MSLKATKLCTVAAGAVACLIAGPALAADVTLKIAHVLPDGDPRDQGADRVVELVEADARCDVDGQVFPAGQLGMFNDINEGVQFGSIEMSVMPASYIVGTEPLFGVFDFPFFWPKDLDSLLALHKGEAMTELASEMEKHNMVMLSVWHTGYKQWTGNKALNTLGAYDGLVSRVMPSPVLAEQQKAFGLSPVTMPFPETYSALQNGAIDAQENPKPHQLEHEVPRGAKPRDDDLSRQPRPGDPGEPAVVEQPDRRLPRRHDRGCGRRQRRDPVRDAEAGRSGDGRLPFVRRRGRRGV